MKQGQPRALDLGRPDAEFQSAMGGYDRDEVDEFVKEAAADRQQRQSGMASLNALSADRQHERADAVVAMARRHADEIRTAAEHEADRILREAERQAASLAGERLDAHQREVNRMAGLRKDIQSCLETAMSALERAREVSAVQADPSVYAPSPDSAMSVMDPVDQASPDQHRNLYWIAVVIWGMFMLSIVLMVW